MTRTILFLLLSVILSSTATFAQDKKFKALTNKSKSTQEEIFYVDVRTPAEFAEGSVKNAVNIPVDQVEHNLSKFKGKKKIIVFCKSGARSARAKTILEQNGIKNVTNGGTWQDVNATLTK